MSSLTVSRRCSVPGGSRAWGPPRATGRPVGGARPGGLPAPSQRGVSHDMEERYDLVVVGGGPAGLTAGIYGGRARLKTLVLEKGSLGGRAATTREVANYPAVGRLSGPELVRLMADQAEEFGAQIRLQAVRSLDVCGAEKVVRTRKAIYRAKAVVVATGTAPRVLGVPGERELAGSGVSYCATCDAAFFEGEDVVVVGSGDQAVEESGFIAGFARSVTVVVVHDEGILDCNALAAEQAMANPKIRFLYNSTVCGVLGDGEVEGVEVKDVRTGKTRRLACRGVFFFCGMVPQTSLLGDGAPCDAQGWLVTGDDMDLGMGGVFAAGDVRRKYLRQIATAVGDGAAAATAAERYIRETDQLERDILAKGPVLLGFWDSGIPGSMEALGACLGQAGASDGLRRVVEVDVRTKRGIAARYGVVLDERVKARAVPVPGARG